HLAGELMKGFEKPRPLSQDLKTKLYNISGNDTLGNKLNKGLPAISLNTHTSLMTAIVNDIGGDYIFTQQVIGYGKSGDVIILFSTSGNSRNIVNAALVAKALNIDVIAITGKTGGELKDVCDILINIDETNTATLQEATIIIYHLICRVVENYFFS
ncbi:MAG: SIS domain-containing protein, partial [Bacteroidales bacterium]|nr:SIS domain-containing protein [Bacteroidales bacterium]